VPTIGEMTWGVKEGRERGREEKWEGFRSITMVIEYECISSEKSSSQL